MLISVENIVSYLPVQYLIVEQVLVFGFATMACGFTYFYSTTQYVKPNYRLASYLGGVVMVSAFLLLLTQWLSWKDTFSLVDDMYVRSDDTFTNGFRYLNWSIDVPMLLLQLVIALNLTSDEARKKGGMFVGLGLLMIFTGYIGQMYEVASSAQLWIWFFISMLFYVAILYLIWQLIGSSIDSGELPESVVWWMQVIRWWFVVVWSLYVIAYIIPAFTFDPAGVVWRQVIYTIADVLSKVVYGVMITQVCIERSAAEGFEPAKTFLNQKD